MDLNKLNFIQIICLLLSIDTATHRWKFMQFIKQMCAILISHITALNQQLGSRQI
jgi:hypothetical protein